MELPVQVCWCHSDGCSNLLAGPAAGEAAHCTATEPASLRAPSKGETTYPTLVPLL